MPATTTVRLGDLQGRPVLAIDSGRRLATVEQGLFHPRSFSLEGLLCVLDPGLAAREAETNPSSGVYRLLPLTEVIAIGPHVVTIPSAAALATPDNRPTLAALIDWARVQRRPRPWHPAFWSPGTRPAAGPPPGVRAPAHPGAGHPRPPGTGPPPRLGGLPVITEEGERIGTLQDLVVETRSGRLDALVVRESTLWSYLRLQPALIVPAAQVRSLGTDACVIRSRALTFPPAGSSNPA